MSTARNVRHLSAKLKMMLKILLFAYSDVCYAIFGVASVKYKYCLLSAE